MKFRCKLSTDGIKILLSAVSTLLKLNDKAVLYLNEDHIRLSVQSDSLENPQGFLELNSSILTSEYRIESAQNNQILFEFNLLLLSKALLSGSKSPGSAILKLSKKQGKPYFTLEFKHDYGGIGAVGLDICHDLPINLLRIEELAQISPPVVPAPTVALVLPRNTKLLKTLVERLSKLSKVIQLTAQASIGGSSSSAAAVPLETPVTAANGYNASVASHGSRGGLGVGTSMGSLQLAIETGGVKVQSFFSALHLSPKVPPPRPGQTTAVSVAINGRKLSILLDFHQLVLQEANLFLTPKEALVINLELTPVGLGSITYYLPILLTEEFVMPAVPTMNRGNGKRINGAKRTKLGEQTTSRPIESREVRAQQVDYSNDEGEERSRVSESSDASDDGTRHEDDDSMIDRPLSSTSQAAYQSHDQSISHSYGRGQPYRSQLLLSQTQSSVEAGPRHKASTSSNTSTNRSNVKSQPKERPRQQPIFMTPSDEETELPDKVLSEGSTGMPSSTLSKPQEEFDPYAEDSEYESYVIDLPPRNIRSRFDGKP